MPPSTPPAAVDPDAPPPGGIRDVAEARSEYVSARLIGENIEHRLAGTALRRRPGYVPPEVDYTLDDGTCLTISVRDSDVRHLDRVPRSTALEHVGLIHRARRQDPAAAAELDDRTEATFRAISARFAGQTLTENEYVIPYTSGRGFTEAEISHKGSILLDLFQKGYATADFNILSSGAFQLPSEGLARCLCDAIRNLEILSGRKLGDPDNPLLIAMRSAVPDYVPGFMPTYLNVGLTPTVLPGLPARYGPDGAARIRLSSRKTLLEALDPDAFALVEGDLRAGLSRAENDALALRLEALIARRAPELLTDAAAQVRFFLDKAYRYYSDHLDVLRNFMRRGTRYPAVIIQRMVCSVIDERSYAGILYSRHSRLGTGVFLQYATAVFGEDLMTGRLTPQERHFAARDDARLEFPAVYHFWDRLFQLEDIFRGPVMVEFTAVHGTFTILQVNAAELSGSGMLTAVMDMHRAGGITAERVRELIKPYHVRQIESDAIDPRSIETLDPFGRGVAVLPRSAVTGRLSFSADRSRPGPGRREQTDVILAKERFTPQDAVDMQNVSGICSVSPAAIHVVTTAQNLGIPALLNLEEDGVRIDAAGKRLVRDDGRELREGDWVTISSRRRTLYAGRAVFAPARLLRFVAGEAVDLTPAERPRFERLAVYYREYRRILESVDASGFGSLQDLGHAIRYGELRDAPGRARDFVNRTFDLRPDEVVARLVETTLGTHLINATAFELLTPDRKVRLFRMAVAESLRRTLSGYHAGAFVIGSLLDPRSPVAFWEYFQAHEIAFLINEWVLHQKYLDMLETIGEKRIARAREIILSGGLSELPQLAASVASFMPLKLSRIDLGEVRRCAPEGVDPQCLELIDLLRRPYGSLVDYADPRSLASLSRVCEGEGLPTPRPDDR